MTGEVVATSYSRAPRGSVVKMSLKTSFEGCESPSGLSLSSPENEIVRDRRCLQLCSHGGAITNRPDAPTATNRMPQEDKFCNRGHLFVQGTFTRRFLRRSCMNNREEMYRCGASCCLDKLPTCYLNPRNSNLKREGGGSFFDMHKKKPSAPKILLGLSSTANTAKTLQTRCMSHLPRCPKPHPSAGAAMRGQLPGLGPRFACGRLYSATLPVMLTNNRKELQLNYFVLPTPAKNDTSVSQQLTKVCSSPFPLALTPPQKKNSASAKSI